MTQSPPGSDTPKTVPDGGLKGAHGGETWRDGGDGDFVRVNLPPPLLDVVRPVGDLASGAEADLVLAERVEDGRRVVVKLYRGRHKGVDQDMLARVRRADREHVVELLDSGDYRGLLWEVLEYVELGSLTDQAARQSLPWEPGWVRAALQELVGALDHVHGLGLVHRDVKPQNVLIRSWQPRLDLVLSDFGLVTVLAASREVHSGSRTPAYGAPEAAWGDVSAARDWWSLGIMCLELLTGEHPFRRPDGRWMEDAEIGAHLSTRPIDVSRVDDLRWQALCRGLLTRDPAHRWGGAQVHEWLSGGSPAIWREEAAQGAARVSPFVFLNRTFDSPSGLAAAFAEHWTDARRVVAGRGEQSPQYLLLVEWLQGQGLEEAVRALQSEGPPGRVLARLLRTMAPGMEPRFAGYSVTREGLLRLVGELSDQQKQATAVLTDIFAYGILSVYDGMPGTEGFALIDDRWHRFYDALNRLLPLSSREDLAVAGRALLLTAALDASGTALSKQVANACEDSDAGQQEWYRDLVTRPRQPNGPAFEVAIILSHPIAREQTRQQRTVEQRQKAERQEAAERQRLDQLRRDEDARRRTVAVARRRDRFVIGWTVALIITVLAPWLFGHYVWRPRYAGPTYVVSGISVSDVLDGAPFAEELVAGIPPILFLCGLLLLRPASRVFQRRWFHGRPLSATFAIALLAGAPWMWFVWVPRVDNALWAWASRSYYSDIPPVSRLAGTPCQRQHWYWMGSSEVAGLAVTWSLWQVQGTSSSSPCNTIEVHRGWPLAWRESAAIGFVFVDVHPYGTVYVARTDDSGSSLYAAPHKNTALIAYNETTGATLWTFQCPPSKVDGIVAPYVEGVTWGDVGPIAQCMNNVSVAVDPSTGKAVH